MAADLQGQHLDLRACRSKVRRIKEDNQLKSGGILPEMHLLPAHCPIQGLRSLHEAGDKGFTICRPVCSLRL